MMNENEKAKCRIEENISNSLNKFFIKQQKLDHIATCASDYSKELMNSTEESNVNLFLGATEQLVVEISNDTDMYSLVGNVVSELDDTLKAVRAHNSTRNNVCKVLNCLADIAHTEAEKQESLSGVAKVIFSLCVRHMDEVSKLYNVDILDALSSDADIILELFNMDDFKSALNDEDENNADESADDECYAYEYDDDEYDVDDSGT